ncbi:MAG: bifunctional demethylmenaquinone methyltransferase/2-methoxy-6-polyprenyl-1,4-benzoquinol methylase UbiE [Deltaproteobacteria bacterium]|nr:bifunctional demethylmenaquinone methyltransferase/2-methoxy-6-polyprenyl-1,4-benzoquinol methylase UbiE [Deltaproteobacteria bacterium]
MNGHELDFVKPMFDAIAPKYDFLNRLLSLRQDVVWRRKLVSALDIPQNGRVLDVACGTGDVVMEILAQKRPTLTCGLDFAAAMLEIAKQKTAVNADRSNTPAICFVAGNGLCLPFSDLSFDAVTIAFGIRNIMDRSAALREFHRVLRPGGMVAVLELATPTTRFFKALYLLYFMRLLPAIGGLFSKNTRAYKYLPDSVLRFPEASEFAGIICSAGFTEVKYTALTFGAATLYIGKKSRL